MTGVIKICGIRRVDHALVTAEAGADLIGFNFYAGSKRRVEPEIAREAITAIRYANPDVRTVGLFVGASRDEILRVHDIAGFDLLQLHKPESLAGLAAIGLPSLLPVRVAPDEDPEALHRHAIDAANGVAEYVLMDGYHPELAGGTGVRADWDVARSLAEQVPLLLAGGLNPGNIAEAIAAVRPAGVDVAGGVERDGEKSPDLIRAFIANARAAFAQSSSSGTSSQDAP